MRGRSRRYGATASASRSARLACPKTVVYIAFVMSTTLVTTLISPTGAQASVASERSRPRVAIPQKYLGAWYAHPLGLRITARGTARLVFPELNADGTDQLVAAMRVTSASKKRLRATVTTAPRADVLSVQLKVGDDVTLRFTSASDLELRPQGISFCGPTPSCESEGFEP